jgi:hypothetical protein
MNIEFLNPLKSSQARAKLQRGEIKVMNLIHIYVEMSQ